MSNHLQQQASNPECSVWVAASAGTGKTKILTDRVLRLLISGVEFKQILCLTFTNAASLEMQDRISKKLQEFAYNDLEQLTHKLAAMLGRAPLMQEVEIAHTLYYKLLESHDKINICTIHSFCQMLLQLFPLEAGVHPAFQILDENSSRNVLLKIRNQLCSDTQHSAVISFFLFHFHENILAEIFDEIIEHKLKFQDINISKYSRPAAKSSAVDGLAALYNDAQILIKKYNIDAVLQDVTISELLFTKDGKKRKSIFSKDIKTQYPCLVEQFENLQEEAYKLTQLRKIEQMYDYSLLLTQLAKILLDKYECYKIENNFLDYDDLIYKTKLLLCDNQKKDWILHKLGQWFDHLLVDEAQDTSPEQWSIVNAIMAEFSSEMHDGSIFVVGDEKQSIFSFQGADLTNFYTVNNNLSTKLLSYNHTFQNITLEVSYRSTMEILDTTYKVLEHIRRNNPELFISNNPKISSFRSNHQGAVEIWPLVRAENCEDTELFWPLLHEHNASLSHTQLLAKKIAGFIKGQILSKRILPSTSQPVKEGDFMILVRTRGNLVNDLVCHLKDLQLQVEGADQVLLSQNLAIMDLIVIAKFVLMPEDNLNLANLLKSPIINMSEEMLYHISTTRGKSSLFSVVPSDIYTRLKHFIQIYQISSLHNFFTFLINTLNLRVALDANNDHKEAIDAFLRLSYNYPNQHDGTLQGFVSWFENNETRIKRDIEASNKIRIMTVHGAKGLQAPIVILCDTTSVPVNKNRLLWTDDGAVLSSMNSADSPDILKELKRKRQQRDLQEYIRLLYVAMTRAEDHLIICGSHGKNKLPDYCWYELIHQAVSNDNHCLQGDPPEAHTTAPSPATKQEHTSTEISTSTFLLSDALVARIVSSYSATKYQITNSPLLEEDYLEYGRVFHKILEDGIKAKNLHLTLNHPLLASLSLNFQTKTKTNLNKLLNNTEFMNLTQDTLLSEVNIGIDCGEQIKIGRIDLLVISKENICIIDYKSDKTPPMSSTMINEGYVDQLNFYRHAISKLYPCHEVITKILWLENAEFTTVHNAG